MCPDCGGIGQPATALHPRDKPRGGGGTEAEGTGRGASHVDHGQESVAVLGLSLPHNTGHGGRGRGRVGGV